MSSRYRVTRVVPSTVEPELIRIWRGNLPVLGDIHAKLRWSYYDAPERPDRVYLLEARDDERSAHVVGSAGIAVRKFKSPAGELRVALGCDLAVDRSHRTLQPALQLVRRVRRDARAEFDMIYNTPNSHACGLYAHVGYHDLGTMTRYVQVLRAAPYIARVLRSPQLARAFGGAIDLATRVRRSIARRRASGFDLEWLDAPDARFDELWSAAQTAYTIVGRRDARWLAWRCIATPAGRGRIAALVDRATARLCAYAIVRSVDGVAHVGDLFGLPSKLGPLLALLSAELSDDGATSVSFRYLGSSRVTALLAAHGFRARESTRHVYMAAGDAMTGSARARVADAESWHLTDYDEDT